MFFICWLNPPEWFPLLRIKSLRGLQTFIICFFPLSNLLNTKQKCRLVQMERICRRRFNLTEMSDFTFNMVRERKISWSPEHFLYCPQCRSSVVSRNFVIVNCRFDPLIEWIYWHYKQTTPLITFAVNCWLVKFNIVNQKVWKSRLVSSFHTYLILQPD